MSVRVSKAILFAAGCCCFLPLQIRAQTAADPISDQVRSVFTHSSDAVVRIEGRDAHGTMLGTGFFIDPKGTLYTSYTIAGDSDELTVYFRDKRYPATRLMADARSGVALLKIDAETPFLGLGNSHELAVATPVMVVGYPMEFGASPAFGVVSGFDIKYNGKYLSTAHIRASIAVAGGEGGAPMLNLKGEAVGILISSAVGGGSCFALPIEAAEKLRRDYVRFGKPRPGYLGAELVSTSGSDTSALIARVDESGPAAKAGIQVGDVITELGNHKVTGPEDVVNAAFYVSAGDEVPITILRNGASIQLTVKAADRPSRDPHLTVSPNEGSPLLKPAFAGSEANGSMNWAPQPSQSPTGLQIHD